MTSSACSGDHADASARPAPQAAPPATAAQTPPAAPPALRQSQRDLLQLAFDAASMFPSEPHAKNRSRAQDQVVAACFELGQPDLAVSFGRNVTGWRRGCIYADFAAALARRNETERAREYVGLAMGVIAAEKENPTAQEWRRDLIALKVARVQALLGDIAAAEKLTRGLDASSANAVDDDWAATAADRVELVTPERAAAELAALDRDFPQLSLGQQGVALTTVARLHEKFFANQALRRECEQRAAVAWAKVMPAIRLQALARMARTGIAAGDREGVADVLAAMRTIIDGHSWRPEDRLPEVGRLIELTAAAGNRDRARADLEDALRGYHEQRDKIVDIYRAEALRPLALAWYALGDTAQGEQLLALAIEEGLENPNSRPRCDDLVDTCIALATHGIEPSPATWTRLREVQRGLGNPW